MTRFFLVSLILLIFILRVSAAKKELTDPQNELQHKKAEIKKSDPQIELQYKKEEMKRFGLLVEEHVDGTVSRIRLKNDFERDSDYELQGGKYIYWIAPEAMDKKLETEEKAEINKKAAPAAPNKKTKKAPDVPDKGLSDGVHVEIPWCGLEENPMDNCDPQSRKVKKVGIAVVKDIKDAYKLTGEKLHIPRGATGSVVHFRRWDAQGKPVKGPIRMKLRGIEHFPGIYRFPDNEGDAESEGKLLLADDEKNKVEPCVDEDGNKEMGCLVIESQVLPPVCTSFHPILPCMAFSPLLPTCTVPYPALPACSALPSFPLTHRSSPRLAVTIFRDARDRPVCMSGIAHCIPVCVALDNGDKPCS